MNAELAKLGTGLRESSEEQREKATETIIKNLRDIPAYYSMMEHYETTTRNIKGRKPSFKSFVKELSSKLLEWTNKRLIISFSKENSLPTLKEQKKAEASALSTAKYLWNFLTGMAVKHNTPIQV